VGGAGHQWRGGGGGLLLVVDGGSAVRLH
jgi:hypothetical protein